MSIPITAKKPGSALLQNAEKHPLIDLLEENTNCEEIRLQIGDDGINRVITRERIHLQEQANVEKLCREYANQDISIKIRNGKKVLIERSRIISP